MQVWTPDAGRGASQTPSEFVVAASNSLPMASPCPLQKGKSDAPRCRQRVSSGCPLSSCWQQHHNCFSRLPNTGGGAWQTPFESMEIGLSGSSRRVRACTVQVPLEGVLQQGGVAFVLRTGSGQWVSSQTRGSKQLDFYVGCREVGCLLRPRNDPQRPPVNAWD